jgi:hypothetical protein
MPTLRTSRIFTDCARVSLRPQLALECFDYLCYNFGMHDRMLVPLMPPVPVAAWFHFLSEEKQAEVPHLRARSRTFRHLLIAPQTLPPQTYLIPPQTLSRFFPECNGPQSIPSTTPYMSMQVGMVWLDKWTASNSKCVPPPRHPRPPPARLP